MFPTTESMTRHHTAASQMTLSGRLITLAQDADSTGSAEQLVQLAITIFDEAPRRPA